MATKPPMDPNTDEADLKQLSLARGQGAACAAHRPGPG